MEQFYIAEINTKQASVNLCNNLGLFASRQEAIEFIEGIKSNIVNDGGIFCNPQRPGVYYVILPVSEYVGKFVFFNKVYDVYYKNESGRIKKACVNTITDLDELESDDPIMYDLKGTLGATEILGITIPDAIETKNVDFHAIR